MKFKSLAAAAIGALALSCASANASPTWTLTFQGKINSGTDTSGVFGAAGQDLAGRDFTETITANTDFNLWALKVFDPHATAMLGAGPGFTATVTVNGRSASFTTTSSLDGQQNISDDLSATGSGGDQVFSYEKGMTADGNNVETLGYAYSRTRAFVPSLDFGQAIQVDAADLTANISFVVTGLADASFNGRLEALSVNQADPAPANVPEPGALALLGLGAAGLGVARRRRIARPA